MSDDLKQHKAAKILKDVNFGNERPTRFIKHETWCDLIYHQRKKLEVQFGWTYGPF